MAYINDNIGPKALNEGIKKVLPDTNLYFKVKPKKKEDEGPPMITRGSHETDVSKKERPKSAQQRINK